MIWDTSPRRFDRLELTSPFNTLRDTRPFEKLRVTSPSNMLPGIEMVVAIEALLVFDNGGMIMFDHVSVQHLEPFHVGATLSLPSVRHGRRDRSN